MVAQTESEIESIDTMNGDLIEILAELADGNDIRLALVGDGPHKMLRRTDTNNVVEDQVIYASDLIENGSVVDTIELGGTEAELQIL